MELNNGFQILMEKSMCTYVNFKEIILMIEKDQGT